MNIKYLYLMYLIKDKEKVFLEDGHANNQKLAKELL
jgi:hypothetical protein